jgi:hypothetical protein
VSYSASSANGANATAFACAMPFPDFALLPLHHALALDPPLLVALPDCSVVGATAGREPGWLASPARAARSGSGRAPQLRPGLCAKGATPCIHTNTMRLKLFIYRTGIRAPIFDAPA